MIIGAGTAQQYAFVKCCNRMMRYSWFNHCSFDNIDDTPNRADQGLWIYNNECPNMVLNVFLTMLKFAQLNLCFSPWFLIGDYPRPVDTNDLAYIFE
jgi:hypothetical protein